MKQYKNIHALVRVDEKKGTIGGYVFYLLDSLKNQVGNITILIPDGMVQSQRRKLKSYTPMICTYEEFDVAFSKQEVFRDKKVLVFDEFCFGPVDREAFSRLLAYLDGNELDCLEIIPGYCAMVRALQINACGTVFFNINDLMDTDLNVSSCEKPGKLLEQIEQTGYDTNLIWEYLLRRYNIEDIKNALHLEYILPWRDPLAGAGSRIKAKAAIIAHLYYEEMVEECFRYLRQVPSELDIYITTSNQNTKNMIEKLAGEWKRENCRVILKENRGRDVSALLVACHDILLEYEYIGFVHDKKSAGYLEHKSEISSFNYNLWENMLKNRAYVGQVLRCFEERPSLGLLVPPEPYYASLMGYLGKSWGRCYEGTREFAMKLGLDCPMNPDKLAITVSTTFWCRTQALKPLFSYPFRYEDFPEEPMSADGTFNHVIEHILAYVAQHQMFYTGILMNDDYASLRGNGLQMLLIRALNEMRKGAVILKPDDIIGIKESSQRLITFCGSFSKIYIYGAGTYGRRCYAVLKHYHIQVEGFVVSDGKKSWNQYEGTPVYQLSELEEEKNICGIILALNASNQKEVRRLLDERGYRNRISITEGMS